MTFVRPEERQGTGTRSVEGTGQAGAAAGEQAGDGQEGWGGGSLEALTEATNQGRADLVSELAREAG